MFCLQAPDVERQIFTVDVSLKALLARRHVRAPEMAFVGVGFHSFLSEEGFPNCTKQRIEMFDGDWLKR